MTERMTDVRLFERQPAMDTLAGEVWVEARRARAEESRLLAENERLRQALMAAREWMRHPRGMEANAEVAFRQVRAVLGETPAAPLPPDLAKRKL